MHPVIEEIQRWRVGEPVRSEVQRRWQAELLALDAELTQLRQAAKNGNGTVEMADKAGKR